MRATPARAAPARAALVLLLAALGCGYRFVAPGGSLPGGVRRVCAPVLVNRTAEPAAEALFTRALREQLVRQDLAAEEGCEASLRGELLSLGSGVGLLKPGGVVSYRLSATLELTLQRGDEVLKVVQVSGEEDFVPGRELSGSDGRQHDVLGTEGNREASLQRLAESLAREALDQLATRF